MTPIYDQLVADLFEPPTGAPVCICDASPADCCLHPAVRFALGGEEDWERCDAPEDESTIAGGDAAAQVDAVTEELAAVGHA